MKLELPFSCIKEGGQHVTDIEYSVQERTGVCIDGFLAH